MKDMHEIAVQVEETLSSLDGAEKKKVDPFFYTRVEQRLKNQVQLSGPIEWIVNSPLVRPGFVASLILINAVSFIYLLGSGGSNSNVKPTMNEIVSVITSDTLTTAYNESNLIFNEDE